MPARSIGTGTLSFGMVSIPIRLYPAGESASAVSFNLLHGKCKSRLKQQYVCPKDNEIVPRDQMVKGYEFSKEQYVTFTEEELKAMAEEAQKAIEITEFVPASKVDPVYFDGAYYLGPDKGGEKAYRLLNEAMKQTGRAALAKWAARGKQYLVMIRPVENGLVMQQLLYKDEVRPIAEVPIDDAEVKEAELKLAVQLVEQIASDEFHPENYEDEVRKRYHEAIQRKVEGQEITAAPEAPARADHRPHGGAQGQPRREGCGGGAEGGRTPPRGPPAPKAEPARSMPDNLARVSREVVHCERCPRLRRWCREVARTKVKRFQDQEYWGRPVPGFGDPRARLLVVGPRPRRARRQPHGPRLHRGPLRRLPVRGPPPRRLREPARVDRRATTASACATATSRRSHAARRPPTSRPRPRSPAAASTSPASGRCFADLRAVLVLGRIAMDGFLAMLREAGRPLPRRPRVRPRRHPRPRRRRPALLLLPRLPAEHVHRPPHPALLRRGPREGEAPPRPGGAWVRCPP